MKKQITISMAIIALAVIAQPTSASSRSEGSSERRVFGNVLVREQNGWTVFTPLPLAYLQPDEELIDCGWGVRSSERWGEDARAELQREERAYPPESLQSELQENVDPLIPWDARAELAARGVVHASPPRGWQPRLEEEDHELLLGENVKPPILWDRSMEQQSGWILPLAYPQSDEELIESGWGVRSSERWGVMKSRCWKASSQPTEEIERVQTRGDS
ncbi:MAG: hypothetical protein LBJ69_00395 [Holosporales bacterium]|jgi:hypothetical protein|nr:hypothetical protein [Holosporales bacterium]